MEITWYGHSCFRIMERGVASIVTDPYDESLGYGLPRLKADIVTISHEAPGHSAAEMVKGYRHVLDRPGEYEISGVFITGIATYDTEKPPEETRYNVIYVFDFDGVTLCHLGDLDHVPGQAQIEALGPVDVLLVPVGGGGGLSSGQAAEVISLIEPSMIVPMHYQTADVNVALDPLDKFLKEMGATAPEELEASLKVTRSSLSDETQIVVLDYNH